MPVISIYEVFKKVLRERGENDALQVASMMQGGQIVDLDYALALEAARHPLPLADSIIYATAMSHDAIFWTQDEHFKDLPSVRFFQEIQISNLPGADALSGKNKRNGKRLSISVSLRHRERAVSFHN